MGLRPGGRDVVPNSSFRAGGGARWSSAATASATPGRFAR